MHTLSIRPRIRYLRPLVKSGDYVSEYVFNADMSRKWIF